MGQVSVKSVTVESHLETVEVLKRLIEGSTVELSFVADRGNGADVNLKLHPQHFDDQLKRIFLSQPIQKRMEEIGLEIKEI